MASRLNNESWKLNGAVAGVAVTVAAEADLGATRALWIGQTGDLVVTMLDGNDVTFTNVPVGLYPFAVQMVRNTTTADDIVALY